MTSAVRAWPGRLPILFIVIMLPGCATLSELLGGSRPSAALEGVRFTGLSLSGVEIDFDARIENPYSVDLPLLGLDLALSSGETPFLESRLDQSGTVPASGAKRLTIPARIEFAGLLATLRQLKPGGSIPYQADIGVSVDAPAIGPLRLPLSHKGEIGVPVPPSVRVKSVRLARLGLTEIRAEAVLEADSTNSFPIELSSFDAAFAVRGRPLARSRITSPFALDPGGRATWTLPISVNPVQAGQVFVTLFQGDALDYGLDGELTVGTPFGRLEAPVDFDGRAPLR